MSIATQQLGFVSSNGNDTVHVLLWEDPSTPPRAVLQIAHGMSEYIDRYAEFAAYLAQHGFVVCGNDHLGHGATASSSEQLGYISSKDGATYLVEDIHRLRTLIQSRYPDLPIFLLGHSMGSFITRAYVAKYGEGLAGYICSGTAGPNLAISISLLLADLETHRIGELGRSKLLDNLAFGSYNKRCPEKRTGFDWLTRDTELVDRYVNDPWCGYVFTSAGFRTLFTLVKEVSHTGWAESVPKQLPILMISGRNDPVGNYTKGPKQVFSWLRKTGVIDLTLKLYDDCRHELLNELNRQEVYEDILQWLSKRLLAK